MKRLACVALLAALPAYAQPAPKAEVFARFSHWTKSVARESGRAFIARAGSSEPLGPQLAIKDAAGSDYHGAAIAIVGSDSQVRPLKAGFRTGERFKLRVLTTFAAHVVVENINARDERRQIYPAPSAGVVVVQSGGYALLPLGTKEFFEFTKATGQELLVVSLSHPRAAATPRHDSRYCASTRRMGRASSRRSPRESSPRSSSRSGLNIGDRPPHGIISI